MDYTQNLHLPQWEADDRILRTDFNDAMSKIDAGIAANASIYVEIKSMTTSAETTQIDFDVSDIDFTQYLRVDLFYIAPRAANGNGVSFRLNNRSDAIYYRSSGTGASLSAQNYLCTFYRQSEFNGFLSSFAINPLCGVGFVTHSMSSHDYQNGCCFAEDIKWNALTSINMFMCSGSVAGAKFPVGTTIYL